MLMVVFHILKTNSGTPSNNGGETKLREWIEHEELCLNSEFHE